MKDYNAHVQWKPASANPFIVALIASSLFSVGEVTNAA